MNLDLSTTRLHPPDPVDSSRRPFLTPLPEPGHFLMVLDNTSLDKIKRCHRAAANYLILGREAHAKNAALSFGGAIHAGLEEFHKEQFQCSLSEGQTDMDYRIEVDAMNKHGTTVQDQAVLRYFTENPAPPDEYRTPTTALEVLRHYRKRCNILLHPDYEWEILADEEGPIIERSFELPLAVLPVDAMVNVPVTSFDGVTEHGFVGNVPMGQTHVAFIHLAWSGRLDLLVNVNQRNRVADHKTTSILGDQFIQSFQIASQTIGYVWAGQQLWPQHHPTGFCLNAIALKKPTKGGGSLVERGPKGGEPALSFFRSYFDYSDDRIREWQSDTVALVQDFIHSLVRNHFPLNDKQCFDKYGQCPYHSVCTVDDPRVRERLLASDMYKQVTWNPTAH